MPRWIAYPGYLVALTLLVAAGEHKWLQLLFPGLGLVGQRRDSYVQPPSRDAEQM